MNRGRRRLRRGRRGFTLVELVAGLAILGLLAGTAATMVLGASRVALHATQSLTAGRTVRSLQGFLQQELRDATQGDIAVVAPARIAMARPVGTAMVCAAADSTILVADSAWTGTRQPQPGRDDAWLLIDPVTEVWRVAAVVAAANDSCPGQRPALRLALDAPAQNATLVRIVEPVLLSAYRSGIADWFGLTPASNLVSVQPFAGPLVPATTSWVLFPDRLETRFQPNGAPAAVVIAPLAGP